MLDNRWLTLVQDVKMRRVVPLFVLDRDGLRQFCTRRPTQIAPCRSATSHVSEAGRASLKIGWLAISTRHH